MPVLCCHPSRVLYTEISLRLEPLGLELVAASARAAGHEVRLLDLQVASIADYRTLRAWQPDVVALSLNYLVFPKSSASYGSASSTISRHGATCCSGTWSCSGSRKASKR